MKDVSKLCLPFIELWNRAGSPDAAKNPEGLAGLLDKGEEDGARQEIGDEPEGPASS